ncbi:hypothetical protein CDAR_444391 [Caerostris darwini]|uniref:Uncharacterized protein n=1 Tax=Caerostris darwini TaxID=1538125 RepID=A0AAV4XBK2_9ARAC|nr:hypothetical protein CDAR_444391 [Caerostris darwini]
MRRPLHAEAAGGTLRPVKFQFLLLDGGSDCLLPSSHEDPKSQWIIQVNELDFCVLCLLFFLRSIVQVVLPPWSIHCPAVPINCLNDIARPKYAKSQTAVL